MTDNPEPGWYPYPAHDGFECYWDGNAWTDQKRPGKRGKKRLKEARRFALFGKVVTAATVPVEKSIERREAANAQQAQVVCPHCKVSGNVTTTRRQMNKGIDGTKAAGAVVTGGASIWLTGLSHREQVTQMRCSNCGVIWAVE